MERLSDFLQSRNFITLAVVEKNLVWYSESSFKMLVYLNAQVFIFRLIKGLAAVVLVSDMTMDH